ncbi:8-oxo-dGDP phosphatase NUDT18 [Engraulis encrasicolus]|uniref:8-oxo-dGDP phosphatase NUDT18 n=1 Tax=Engraulis encrasicolus TaxID=184585 RepID=UPI002FD52FAC
MGSATLNLEQHVNNILNGEGMEVTAIDSAPEPLKAVVVRKTVCYIVSALIFNSKKELLMVQEAKPECYGRWYLPAGRMEEGESIEEAVKREVREEAGFECQPITLVQVQEQGPQWVRFAFVAEITGGTLKTEGQADAESLQACWWDRESDLPLRGRDILPLIEMGLRYVEKPRFAPMLPLDLPCPVVCQRLVLTFASGIYVWILVGNGARGPIAISSVREEQKSRKAPPLATANSRGSESEVQGVSDALRGCNSVAGSMQRGNVIQRGNSCEAGSSSLQRANSVQRGNSCEAGGIQRGNSCEAEAALDDLDVHLPVSLSTKTHTVTWAAHRLVQESMPSCYYDLDINTHGLLGVQHCGRQPGKTDGLVFNTLVSITLERRGSGGGLGLGGEAAGGGGGLPSPPAVETGPYRWHKVDSTSLRDDILRRIRQGSTVPILSLY